MGHVNWSRLVPLAVGLATVACSCGTPRPPTPRSAGPDAVVPARNRHLALGVPKGPADARQLLLDEGAYVVSYDPRKNNAAWVAWRLDEHDLGHAGRRDDFQADDRLPSSIYRVTPGDYAHTGFDRGHLCPSGDRTASHAENAVTFLMTNIHPQRPELNRFSWEEMEEYERELAKQHHEVFIVAGGIFDIEPPTIGHGVAIPKAEYKILVVLEEGQGPDAVTVNTTVIAAVMPNEATVNQKPWTAYLTSVDEVEQESGYDFLTAVPEEVQRAIEARGATVPERTVESPLAWTSGARRPRVTGLSTSVPDGAGPRPAGPAHRVPLRLPLRPPSRVQGISGVFSGA
jgi:endonuclease G